MLDIERPAAQVEGIGGGKRIEAGSTRNPVTLVMQAIRRTSECNRLTQATVLAADEGTGLQTGIFDFLFGRRWRIGIDRLQVPALCPGGRRSPDR